jgi:hypothetical protein
MDESTIQRLSRTEQCRKNAQEKSEKKRQQTLSALVALQRERKPISELTVAKRAGVSRPFLRKHEDLRQRIAEAGRNPSETVNSASSEAPKLAVLEAIRRRLVEMKSTLAAKEVEIRQKNMDISRLFGKLASRSEMSEAEVVQTLEELTRRLRGLEE